MKRKHISGCFACKISNPNIKISPEELADFIMKYEDSNECNSFYNYSIRMHNTLVDEATDFLDSIDPVLEDAVKHAKSLDEVYVKLSIEACDGWRIPHEFWEKTFKSLIDHWDAKNDTVWIEWLLCNSSELAEDCVKRGLFDDAVVNIMLIKVLKFIFNHSDEYENDMNLYMKVIKLCKAWDNRRTAVLSCNK